MRELALELLEFVDDVVDELGSRRAVEYLHTLLREGSSADRQQQVYSDSGSLTAVVDHLCRETMAGLSLETAASA
jgi:glutamate---cysteine ligase / carboxylate-amine ligase